MNTDSIPETVTIPRDCSGLPESYTVTVPPDFVVMPRELFERLVEAAKSWGNELAEERDIRCEMLSQIIADAQKILKP